MAEDFSFDVVSKVDMNLVSESVQIALKEVGTRYDFRGANSDIQLDAKAGTLTLTSADEARLKALFDVLCTRMAKRGLPLKNFEPQKVEQALGGTARQPVTITQGIPSEKAKEIVAEIKKSGLKVQGSIQGDQVRVTSRSKDALQGAIQLLKGKDFGLALQFTNYR